MASFGSAVSAPGLDHGGQLLFVLGQPGTLEVEGGDLPLERPHRPVAANALDLVEGALEGIFYFKEKLNMAV